MAIELMTDDQLSGKIADEIIGISRWHEVLIFDNNLEGWVKVELALRLSALEGNACVVKLEYSIGLSPRKKLDVYFKPNSSEETSAVLIELKYRGYWWRNHSSGKLFGKSNGGLFTDLEKWSSLPRDKYRIFVANICVYDNPPRRFEEHRRFVSESLAPTSLQVRTLELDKRSLVVYVMRV